MKAVIMAGGRGTRLRPLTCHLPKPMVPLIGKPCMAYMVELLKKHGIHEIAVTLQYMPEVIRGYFGDGRDFGVDMHYFEETTPLGTAGSVKNAHAFLDDTFIVISGDALTDFDLGQALAYHKQKQSQATLLLAHANYPLDYGVVLMNDEGNIVKFTEKPSWGEVCSDTVNTGIYILEPETLEHVPYGLEFDFSRQLFPALLQEKVDIYGYISMGYWSDIGNLDQYRQTQFDMLDGKVQIDLPGKQIRPGIYVADGVETSAHARLIGPAYIGEGSRLEEGVEIGEYCVIGKNNRLSKGSLLARSVIWDHNHIDEHNELVGSTLTSRIISHKASYLGEGSVIGNHVVIGAGSRILPNVKVWPHKQIREQTQLHASLIWGDHISKTLFKTHGVSGIPNLDLTPEFVAKFSSAYGATLASGQALTVSCSPHSFTRLLKRTMTASLQSVGTHVIDLGDSIAPAASFAIRQLGAAGGIHIDWPGKGSEICCLACIDAAGLPLTKADERKVENNYWQEDYGRASVEHLGSYKLEPSWMETYLDALAKEIVYERDGPVHRSLRIVIEASAWLQSFIIPFFEKLGVEAIHITAATRMESLQTFIPLSEADFGLRLKDDGQGMQLLTEQGVIVDGDLQTVFLYLCYLHSRPGAAIGAPASSPHLLESLAEGLGATIRRTKETSRSILEATEQTRMHPLFDSLFAVGLILLHWDRTQVPISELLSLFPSFYLHRENVDCPWDSKGQVMRSMMERAKDTQTELVDGIKFYHEEGWVLLLPDADNPAFQVVAHAANPLAAQSLGEAYREHILNALQ
ncbi:sugar phosphate nucleotidyltransferase [Paenibacillus sp. SI8]|uniref:sugar phosphate nucleotidyltransferase n=1 Tax=unclassified Paenibacillus TaxID=185978 RepID=UPI0034677EB0